MIKFYGDFFELILVLIKYIIHNLKFNLNQNN